VSFKKIAILTKVNFDNNEMDKVVLLRRWLVFDTTTAASFSAGLEITNHGKKQAPFL
jgi:hypothetical protein